MTALIIILALRGFLETGSDQVRDTPDASSRTETTP
jgi:hypothetical protein